MTEDLRPPFRQQFDNARDPYTARNALGITGTGGSGGGAPPDAQYIVAVDDPTLTNDRVLTNTATVTWDFSTAGQVKANAVGGGNVSNSGTPSVGQYAKWVTATTIQGVAPTTVLSDIGGAPVGAEFITSSADATLTAERVLTDTATLTWDRTTAGQVKANVSGYQPLDADLTSLAAAAATNAIYYRSAANTWSPVNVSTGLAFSGGNLTATGGGGTATPGPPQGRLTLQTATPVMTTTQSAKTTIFYTPYVGNQVPIYDGTNMVMTTFAELSVATTDTTKNPAAIGASKVNDWFVWSDSGTLRLSHGPDWTSDTARSAGTALVMVNGILLNNAAITNGPAASRGTYVGTTRSNASSQLDWIYGTSAAAGGAAFHGAWNCYNRVLVSTLVQSSDASWTYSTANTWRAPANSSTFRAQLVIGLNEDAVQAIYYGQATPGAATVALSGIGLDSMTVATGVRGQTGPTGTTGVCIASYYGYVGLGFHYLSALERNTTATGTLWTGLSSNDCQSGLAATFWA